MAKSRARKLADIIVGAGIDIDGNLTFDGGSTSADLTFADNDKANFGDSSDLQIFHNGSHSFIKDAGTGDLYIGASNNLALMNSAFSENYLLATTDGAVNLYYDGSAKLATFSGGVSVTGQLNATTMHLPDGSTGLQLGTSNDTKFFHDGSNSKITHSGSGGFYIGADTLGLQTGAHNENYLTAAANGAVSLYYDNSAKFATTSTGVDITGTVTADGLATDGVITINGSGSEDRYLKFALDGRGSAFTGENAAFIFCGQGGSGDFLAGGLYLQSRSATAGREIGFITGTTPTKRMVIDSSGNVGIGTTSPGTKLDVTTVANTAGIRVTAPNTTSQSFGATIAAGTNSSDYAFNINNAAGTGILRVRGDGNVGIGTSSPSALLEVSGSLKVTGTSTLGVVDASSFTDVITNTIYTASGSLDIDTVLTGRDVTFTQGSNNLMIVKGTGNVGIGTSSPYFPLHVQGVNSTNGAAKTTALFFDTSSAAAGTGGGIALGGYSNGTGGDIYHFGNIQGIKENSTAGNYASAMIFSTRANGATPVERMRISSIGRVGIGVTAISADGLHIGTINGNCELDLDHTSGKRYRIASKSDSSLVFEDKDSSAERMRINSSGNVGIGTSSPSSTLEVVGSGITLRDSASGTYFNATDTDGSHNAGYFMRSGSSNWYTLVDVSGKYQIYDGDASAVRVIVDGSGNVGIGTTSPQEKLQINGNLRMFSAGYPLIDIGITTSNYFRFLHDNPNDIFKIGKNGAATLNITGSGNVGVGTSNPSGLFNVHSASGDANVFITTGTTNASTTLFFGDSGSSSIGRVQYDHGNNSMRFQTNASEAMRITSSGNVGINNTGAPHDLTIYNASGPTLYLVGGSYNDDVRIAFGGGDTTNTSGNGNTGAQIISSQSAPGGQATGNLKFLTNGGDLLEERMRIHSSGNVSIGTTGAYSGTGVTSLTVNATSYPTIALRVSDTNVGAIFGYSNAVAHHALGSRTMQFHTNDVERMRIDVSGNLLVGLTSISDATSRTYGNAFSGTSSYPNWKSWGNGSHTHAQFRNGTSVVGSITTTSSATTYNTSSDQRLKDNIVDAPSASDDIDAIQVRSFDWKADGSHQKYGMVAQELQSVAPEAVSGDADSDDMMGVDYSKLVPMLVKEIQSLRARVAELEGE